ncbi:MAG TPA: DUF4340 domain-containing protein [Vicinamibacteria bacterium]|nr:DUF4340 domain-containing protein [Vicinamibacteria bacterium]
MTERKSPFLWTYGALAVLLGLGAYIYFVESKKEAEPQKPKEKVLTLSKSKVTEVTLAPAGGTEIHLVKSATGWRMAAPMVVAADSTEVDSLLGSLEGLEIDEVVVPNAPQLADYGLAPPKLKVALLQEGGPKPLELLLGEKAPTGNGIYAKLPSQPRVFTIPSYLESSLNKKPFDLRDRDVLHVKRDAIKTLEVKGPSESYSLSREGGGEFGFTKPLVTRAGRWSVDGLLGNLESLRMDSVVAEEAKDLKPFGLAKPTWSLALGLNDGTTKTLEIGSSAAEKKYYAREGSSALVATVSSALVDDLAKGMGELRAKRLLELATYEVEGFEAALDGKIQVYERSSTKSKDGFDVYKWKRTKPDSKDLETPKIEDLLFKLGGAEIKEFLDKPEGPATYALDKPVLKVTIRLGSGKPPIWAEIGEKDGGFFGRRPGDDSILRLDSAKAGEIVKGFKGF